MILNDDEIAVLESDVQNIGVFFRLETDPILRLWLGFGNIEPGTNVLDASGATYIGFGEITDIPEFEQMINGSAQRIVFSLSGVSEDVLAVASGDDAENIKGKKVSVGIGIFDANFALLGEIKWCANYTADYISVSQMPTEDPAAKIIRIVKLSCGSIMTGRRRPARSYFTSQDQVARHPGDNFCIYVSRYANGFSKAWPTFPP